VQRAGLLLLSILLVIASGCKKTPEPDQDNPYIPPEGELGDPIVNTASIEGYADKRSYYPGDQVELMISCAEDTLIDLRVYRIGMENELIYAEDGIAVSRQDYFTYSYSYGCDWSKTCSFPLPIQARSGMYSAVIKNAVGNTDYITFIVKQSEGAVPSPVLVIAPTNTWQAYNLWGGASFYRFDPDGGSDDAEEIRHSVIVSFRRPNKADRPFGDEGHLAAAEGHLLKWLEQNAYDYAMICDEDLHERADVLEGHKVVILQVHPEYYSSEMLDHLQAFQDDEGHLMYLGANGLYWKIGLSDEEQIECRKDGDSHRFTTGVGGLWKDLGRSPVYMVGSHYSKSGYDTYHPYQVIDADHWVFEGTGLAPGDPFGENSLNRGKASGHETDKKTTQTPEDFQLLAKGTNPGLGGAEMLIRERPGKGKVFSVGSITYTGALPVDDAVSTITQNVLDRFLE
jgi:hypothetical protein